MDHALKLKSLLEPQVAQGLCQIRLTVLKKPGLSADTVMQELLTAEEALATGQLASPPGPEN